MHCYKETERQATADQLDREKTNIEISERLEIEMDVLQTAIQRKLYLLGHICRTDDSRKLKALVFDMTEGINRRDRTC